MVSELTVDSLLAGDRPLATMPKRATHTYESEKDGLQNTDLGVYYCMCCGESNLIVGPGVSLTGLPRRKTDGAFVRR